MKNIHLVVHKASLIPLSIVYGKLNATENNRVKLYPLEEQHLDKAYKLLKHPRTHCQLMDLVLRGWPTPKHSRNTKTKKFKQDKADAIKSVIDGGKVGSVAEHFNLNPRSLSAWMCQYRKALRCANG